MVSIRAGACERVCASASAVRHQDLARAVQEYEQAEGILGKARYSLNLQA